MTKKMLSVIVAVIMIISVAIPVFANNKSSRDSGCKSYEPSTITTTTTTQPACTHPNMGFVKVERKATCKYTGIELYKCPDCDHVEQRIIPKDPNGHNFEKTVINPTCTSEGYEENYCVYCGHSEKIQPIPATGHNFKKFGANPTCTSDGYEYLLCFYCGLREDGPTTPAIGHNYTWYTLKAPTCSEEGALIGECSNCEDIDIKPIPKLEHNMVNGICTNCDGNSSDSGNNSCVNGHNHTTVLTEATCTEQGYTTYTCECGDSYVDDYTDAVGHKDDNNDGYCDVCDLQICDHSCHKGGFLWRIVLFFNKLFKSNKICSCGVEHY